MRTRQHGLTDTGLQRDNNEDAYRLDPQLGLFVICDGVGGNVSGEVAAQLAADMIRDWVKKNAHIVADPEQSNGQLGALLATGIQYAAYMVFNAGLVDPARKGMKTTTSALLIVGDRAIIAHVGDSRIYLYRDGEIAQLTDDHTVAADGLRKGQLTAESAARMRGSAITRSIGARDHARPDLKSLTLLPSDRLLLCTDGLHRYLDDHTPLRRLFEMDTEAAAHAAVAYALDRGGQDNVTVIFIRCLGD